MDGTRDGDGRKPRGESGGTEGTRQYCRSRVRVWIDIDNAPHVQIFRPIISRLRERGATVEVTSRGRTFVPELLQAAGIDHTLISRGQPAGVLATAGALLGRSL